MVCGAYLQLQDMRMSPKALVSHPNIILSTPFFTLNIIINCSLLWVRNVGILPNCVPTQWWSLYSKQTILTNSYPSMPVQTFILSNKKKGKKDIPRRLSSEAHNLENQNYEVSDLNTIGVTRKVIFSCSIERYKERHKNSTLSEYWCNLDGKENEAFWLRSQIFMSERF